jgi:hypothetical protein
MTSRPTIPKLSPEQYQQLSNDLGKIFSSDDIKVIAKEVLRLGGSYRKACDRHPKGNSKFNFHPETNSWLGLNRQNIIIQTLKDAVKQEYRDLSDLCMPHFTLGDVKSIAEKVYQLCQQNPKKNNRYREACKNYQKPDCPYKFNFHPETHVWLGCPSENVMIGRLKKTVDTLKKKRNLKDQVVKNIANEKKKRKLEGLLQKTGEQLAGQKQVVHAHICTQTLVHMHTHILI